MRFFFTLFCFSAFVPIRTEAQGTIPEYRVKAAFLFNFAQFTEWPQEAFATAKSPIVIGILGVDPFGAFLEETVHNEVIHNRPIEIQRFRTVSEVTNCHILFISRSEEPNIRTILNSLKGKPILTVSDMADFSVRGGMIRLINERNKIRFRINLEAAQAAKLDLSSKLLRAAEIVKTDKE